MTNLPRRRRRWRRKPRTQAGAYLGPAIVGLIAMFGGATIVVVVQRQKATEAPMAVTDREPLTPPPHQPPPPRRAPPVGPAREDPEPAGTSVVEAPPSTTPRGAQEPKPPSASSPREPDRIGPVIAPIKQLQIPKNHPFRFWIRDRVEKDRRLEREQLRRVVAKYLNDRKHLVGECPRCQGRGWRQVWNLGRGGLVPRQVPCPSIVLYDGPCRRFLFTYRGVQLPAVAEQLWQAWNRNPNQAFQPQFSRWWIREIAVHGNHATVKYDAVPWGQQAKAPFTEEWGRGQGRERHHRFRIYEGDSYERFEYLPTPEDIMDKLRPFLLLWW